MRHWKFWDWLSYGLLAFTAVLEALWGAGDKLPDLSHTFPVFYKSFWAYLPLTLITISTAIFLTRLVRPPKEVSRSSALPQEPKPSVIMVERDLRRAFRIPTYEPRGAPDMPLASAYKAVARSFWAQQHHPDEAAILREIEDKLYLNRLSAWGRPTPDSRPKHIIPPEWDRLRLDGKTGRATDSSGTAFHDVQLNSDAVGAVWPEMNPII